MCVHSYNAVKVGSAGTEEKRGRSSSSREAGDQRLRWHWWQVSRCILNEITSFVIGPPRLICSAVLLMVVTHSQETCASRLVHETWPSDMVSCTRFFLYKFLAPNTAQLYCIQETCMHVTRMVSSERDLKHKLYAGTGTDMSFRPDSILLVLVTLLASSLLWIEQVDHHQFIIIIMIIILSDKRIII